MGVCRLGSLLLASLMGVSGCGDGRSHYASGHQISLTGVQNVTSIGDYRILTREVYAARAFTIPKTYVFHFGWTPTAYARRMRATGHRLPTGQDWAKFRARFSESDADKHYVSARRLIEQSDFETFVLPNGGFVACLSKVSGINVCDDRPRIDRSSQIQFAQMVLDQSNSGCRISKVDPPEISVLFPRGIHVSTNSSLYAEIDCS